MLYSDGLSFYLKSFFFLFYDLFIYFRNREKERENMNRRVGRRVRENFKQTLH